MISTRNYHSLDNCSDICPQKMFRKLGNFHCIDMKIFKSRSRSFNDKFFAKFHPQCFSFVQTVASSHQGQWQAHPGPGHQHAAGPGLAPGPTSQQSYHGAPPAPPHVQIMQSKQAYFQIQVQSKQLLLSISVCLPA